MKPNYLDRICKYAQCPHCCNWLELYKSSGNLRYPHHWASKTEFCKAGSYSLHIGEPVEMTRREFVELRNQNNA